MSFSIQTNKSICVPIGAPRVENGVYTGPLEVEGNLYLSGTALTTLSEARLSVGGNLDLGSCKNLQTLPEGLSVGGFLQLSFCEALQTLPEGLEVGGNLILHGCTALTTLPEGLEVGGYLGLRKCTALTTLPEGLVVGNDLNLSGCTNLKDIPPSVICKGTIKHTFKDEDLIYKIDLLNLSLDELKKRYEYKIMTLINDELELPKDISPNINGFVFKHLDWILEREKFLEK